ncbi:MAG: hypothetical protein ABEJ06_00835 [Haloarculaceae archaeon]
MARGALASQAREYVLNEHPALVLRVIECADAVAAGWDGDATTDPDAVADRLETVLEHAGVVRRLPGVLEGAVEAVDGRLRASPVPAAPYVVVTSRGPVLRATTDRGRLVVTVAVFDVERAAGGGARYVRSAETPGEAVDVALRESSQ